MREPQRSQMRVDSDVSVIIPTRDRERLLLRAIESVIAQTFPPREIIVVDDASQYAVSAFLERALPEHGGLELIVITNRERRGGAESRNIGADRASSGLIAFLDSDDFWFPTKLAKQVNMFSSNHSIGLVACDGFKEGAGGEYRYYGRRMYDTDVWHHLINGWTSFPNTSSLTIRSDVFRKIGRFDSTLMSCQDHDLWMRVALNSVQVGYVREPLYVTGGGATNRISKDYQNRMRGIHRFLAKWQSHFESESQGHFKRMRNRYLVKGAFNTWVQLMRNGKLADATRVFRDHLVMNPAFYREVLKRIAQRAQGNPEIRTGPATEIARSAGKAGKAS